MQLERELPFWQEKMRKRTGCLQDMVKKVNGSHNSVIKTNYNLVAENGWRQSWRVMLTQVYGTIVDFLMHSRRRKVNGWFLWRKRSKVPEKHYLEPSQEGGKPLVMDTDTESESLEKL